MFAGLLAAVAGVILAARIRSGNPTSGDGYELDAIASTVVGGTSSYRLLWFYSNVCSRSIYNCFRCTI